MKLNDALNKGLPLKALIYGYGKTRKTTWAGMVAKTNLNGIYCDCDNSAPVLGSMLSAEEQAKLTYINISDDVASAKASWFVSAIAKGKPFIWDEVTRTIVKQQPIGHSCLLINPQKLTSSDCLIIDSFTQLCNSLFIQYATENNIDLSLANKPEWDDYRWAGQLATFLLTSLMALPCNVILISHVKTYEKKRKDKFGKEQTISVRTQPISVSNNHAETISKYFGEVYYFFKRGTGTLISTKTTDDLDCGSRFLEPKEWQFDDLTLEFIANKYNVNRPRELSAIKQVDAYATVEEFANLWNEVRGMNSGTNGVTKPNQPNQSAQPTSTSPLIKPKTGINLNFTKKS